MDDNNNSNRGNNVRKELNFVDLRVRREAVLGLNSNETGIKNMLIYESEVLDVFDSFNKKYTPDVLANCDTQMLLAEISHLRKLILIKTDQPRLVFTQRFDVLDITIGVIYYILSLDQNTEISCEALRLFKRLCRSYCGFINSHNYQRFCEIISAKIDERSIGQCQLTNQIARHAYFLVGLSVRQSHIWAKMLFNAFFYPVFNSIDRFNNNISFQDKKIYDPNIYVLRGFTKMLATDKNDGADDSNSKRLSLLPIDSILVLSLEYFFIHQKENAPDLFTCIYNLKIIKDIIKANFPGTLEILLSNDLFIRPFFLNTLPSFNELSYIPLTKNSFEIIKYIFRNGHEYADYFAELIDYPAIMCFFDVKRGKILPDLSVAAADCAFSIIETYKNKKVEVFMSAIENLVLSITDDEICYKLCVRYTKLIDIMFQVFNISEFLFDINLYIRIAIQNIEKEDTLLSCVTISSLLSLYNRTKIMNCEKEFLEVFESSGGRDAMIRAIYEGDSEVREKAIIFMNTLLNDGTECGRIPEGLLL